MDLRLILRFVSPWRWTLAACGLLMLAEAGTLLAVPLVSGRFAGSLLAGVASPGGAILLALIVLLALLAALRFASSWLLGRTAQYILADLRTRLYDHLQSLPLAYFHERRHGDIVALLTNDVARLATYISGTLVSVIPLALTVAGAIVLMLRIDLRLAAMVAVMIPLFYLVLKVQGRRLRPLSSQLQQSHADSVAIAEENLALLSAIKTYTREPLESTRYRRKIEQILHLSNQELLIYSALGPTVQFLAGAGMVLVVWLLSVQASSAVAARSPAESITFLLYAALLTRPVASLADVYGQTRQARGALERLGAVLKEPPEADPSDARQLPAVRGHIEFTDVHYSYPGRPAALSGVNFEIPAGRVVALTGSNGAGKSTLVHLLMRLMDPAQGRISIDGIDIRSVSLSMLRRQIGLVPQHVLLLNGTVFENIAYGNPEATPEAVAAAARAAQGHEFITRLPQGYETIVGDQGVRLSGGQRQRLALARALLRDPPILVLDEATAMFDPEGERSFVAECRDSLAGRTVILITHRPASLALAHRVLRLEQGRITVLDATPALDPLRVAPASIV